MNSEETQNPDLLEDDDEVGTASHEEGLDALRISALERADRDAG